MNIGDEKTNYNTEPLYAKLLNIFQCSIRIDALFSPQYHKIKIQPFLASP